MDKQKQKIVLGVICALVAIFAAGFLVRYFVVIQKNSAVYDDLQSSVAQATATPAPTQAVTAAPEATQEPEQTVIDFEQVKELNEDVYAWIKIDDTEVSYPILQHPSDDSYYLDYTIEHVKGLPGSIYTERIDGVGFTDFNTVIYGHNMANDTMFGSLNNYRDQSYFGAHNEITIYTETEARQYQIFAAVVYDDRYIPYQYDDTKPEDCQAFLDSLYNNGNGADIIDETVDVTVDSEIITLSTCIGNMPNNRYLVVAVYMGE